MVNQVDVGLPLVVDPYVTRVGVDMLAGSLIGTLPGDPLGAVAALRRGPQVMRHPLVAIERIILPTGRTVATICRRSTAPARCEGHCIRSPWRARRSAMRWPVRERWSPARMAATIPPATHIPGSGIASDRTLRQVPAVRLSRLPCRGEDPRGHSPRVGKCRVPRFRVRAACVSAGVETISASSGRAPRATPSHRFAANAS